MIVCENCIHDKLCIIPEFCKGELEECDEFQNEIVLCKECAWYDDANKGCRHKDGLSEITLTDYCSYGERIK